MAAQEQLQSFQESNGRLQKMVQDKEQSIGLDSNLVEADLA